MDDDHIFEVMPAGEMRRKYDLTAENRPFIKLDPNNVPVPLRRLIPLAERFGISDDLIREDFVRKTPVGELAELRRIVQEQDDLLDDWLAGPAAAGPTFTDEYIAFTCMRMAADLYSIGRCVIVTKSLARLRRLAEAFPEWERPTFHPPASATSLENLERASGMRIPDDFRQFLLQTDAVVAMDIQNGYWIGGSEGLTRSMGRADFPQAADETRVIAVATDGGGNAFLLSAASNRVWRWDHETGRTTDVASSFGEFLEKVGDDWEQFAAANHDWNYLV